MPFLDWMGKSKVVSHHNDVPFRVLERRFVHGEPEDGQDGGNMVIHGDNLEALKALQLRYAGRVNCIYIDPPYNTGNEGWVYNDNVNDPKIRQWLGRVVGKEGEDLTRHDKWLCMMYPRLRLLHTLLAKDGVIFISIDDTEYASLKLVCDEIFGAGCFVSNISWQRTYSTRNDSKGVVVEVEHILVYSARPGWMPAKLPRTAAMDALYHNPDNDVTAWASDNPFAADAATHQGMVYAIQHPFTGRMLYPSPAAHWRYSQEVMLSIMNRWCPYELKDLQDAKERAAVCGVPESDVRPGVLGIVLAEPLESSRAKAEAVLRRGQWPRFYFTRNGKGGIRRKTYLDNVGGRPPTNLWPHADAGHTDEAKKEILAIFDRQAVFDTPKPRRLLEYVLRMVGDKDALVLDSFAGSGTTAHAVLAMNKADGGKRRFILVEMMDYARSVTAERVRRVIDGYGTGSGAMEGTGGAFGYYELGEPVLLTDGSINEAVGQEKLREYVWYTETRLPWTPPADAASSHFLGTASGVDYYFYYTPDAITVLDYDFLSSLPPWQDGCVIYADVCHVGADMLAARNVTFKKIPRDIARL